MTATPANRSERPEVSHSLFPCARLQSRRRLDDYDSQATASRFCLAVSCLCIHAAIEEET